MEALPVLLVLASTFMHAGWNLLARRGRSEAAFFRRMLWVVVLAGSAPAAACEFLVSAFSLRLWACGLVSGGFCGLYFFFLARAYRLSDFTTVYPVARALPVLLVAFGDLAFGRHPTPTGWVGLFLVFCGCLLAPLRSLRTLALGAYWNKASLWMVLTAVSTVGYSLIDKAAAEAVSRGPLSAARYEVIFFLAAFTVYIPLWRTFLKEESSSISPGWRGPAAAGLLNFTAYWLVLWAYQLSSKASYVVAFRQFSIVIGVVAAFALFKEKGLGVRLAGSFMIVGGLVLIGLQKG